MPLAFSNGWFFVGTGIVGLLAGGYGAWAVAHGYYLLSNKNTQVARTPPAIALSEGQSGGQTAATIYNNFFSNNIPPSQGAAQVSRPEPQEREFVQRTPRQLLSFYASNRTILEANRLMRPYIGQWIEVNGKVLEVGHGTGDGDQTAVVLRDEADKIECRFKVGWRSKLERLAKDEQTRIIGKIGPTQNGSQLYLLECEIL